MERHAIHRGGNAWGWPDLVWGKGDEFSSIYFSLKCLWVSQVKISSWQLYIWVWSSGEGLEVVIQVVPEVIRLDKVTWEKLEGKPYFRDGAE